MTTFTTPQTHDEEVQKIHADVRAELPSSNPYLKDGLIRAQNTGLGRRIFDVYYTMRSWLKNFLPNTAKGEFQKLWMEVRNIVADVATKASGYVTATGTLSSSISSGEILKINGIEYEVLEPNIIAANVRNVSSLTRFGSTVTCETETSHNLVSGMSVTIAGANESNTNGTFINIAVLSEKYFSYTNASSATTATGTITASFTGASLHVRALIASVEGNQDAGTQLQFDSEITGVDEYAGVQFGGLAGGSNAQTEDEINAVLADTFANPVTLNNGFQVKRTILEYPGNTRAWVYYAYPDAGQVTAYFVQDDKENSILPSSTDEINTQAAVAAIYNAHTDPSDIIIEGPAGVGVDVVISDVFPATQSMRDAVAATVRSYYRSRNDVGVDDTREKLTSAIYQTYDSVTGQSLQYMKLDSPTIDTQVIVGQLPVLNSVSVS